MEITGTIKTVLPMQSGTSKAGNAWQRLTVVIEYGDRYPKELALSLMNDKCNEYAKLLTVGAQLKFHFDVSSREYNGRYYTECMAWKVEPLNAQPEQQTPMQNFEALYGPAPQQTAYEPTNDELPF